MKIILLMCLLFAARISFSDECELIVRQNCQTNVLCTWEGEFALSEVSPLLTNDLYVCTFTNASCEGTLIEMYSCRSNELTRVFRSDTTIKGVTPVILQIGTITNLSGSVFWGMWRHPGNGGNKQYDTYEYTNMNMRILSTSACIETDGGLAWFQVDEDMEPIALTNLVFSFNLPLWTNQKTRYKDN